MGRYLAGVWVDGQVQVVDTSALRPYVDIYVNDVNSHGMVVGYRLTDTSEFHTDAWVYQAGRARALPALHPGDSTWASAINSRGHRGDIVGTNRSPFVYGSQAVLWPADQPGTVRELTVSGDSPDVVDGTDIDDDGTVLGNVGPWLGEQQYAYVWPARGTGYRLAVPEGTIAPFGYAVHAGVVAGTVLRWDGSMGIFVPTRWNLRTGIAEVVANANFGEVVEVNRQGTIATTRALIYRSGTVREPGGEIRVLSDRHTAAGYEGSPLSNAVMWKGC